MFKKSRVTDLKHRKTRKKQNTRRILARKLIKGDVTVDQLGRLAGEASNGVLRTVNYLSETEGVTLTDNLSQAVAQAVAPGSSSSSAILARMAAAVAAAPKPAPAVREAVVETAEPAAVVQEAIEEVTASAAVEPANGVETENQQQLLQATQASEQTVVDPLPTEEAEKPKKRTRAATKTEEPPEPESAPKRRTRASTKPAAPTEEEVAKAEPKKRTRAAPKAVQAAVEPDKPAPKRRTRAAAKPKE